MQIAQIVRWILDSEDWTQERLATELGVSQPTVNRWLGGADPRGTTRDSILELYRTLKKIEGREVGFPTKEVELKGYIGAGGTVEAVDSGHLGTVEAPLDASDETVAGLVRGLSMLPVYEEGTTLFWSAQLPPDALLNKRCVVQLGDGRIMVKTITQGSRPNLYTLRSVNPAYEDIVDVPVEWVAKIDWVKPS